jgi:hypothetical protein
MFLITFDWVVTGDLFLVAMHLFKWVMISPHLPFVSPHLLPPDPPYILTMFPCVLLSVFTVIPLRYSSLRSSLQFPIVYFTILAFFCIPLSSLPRFLVESVFLFLTRISQPLQIV